MEVTLKLHFGLKCTRIIFSITMKSRVTQLGDIRDPVTLDQGHVHGDVTRSTPVESRGPAHCIEPSYQTCHGEHLNNLLFRYSGYFDSLLVPKTVVVGGFSRGSYRYQWGICDTRRPELLCVCIYFMTYSFGQAWTIWTTAADSPRVSDPATNWPVRTALKQFKPFQTGSNKFEPI